MQSHLKKAHQLTHCMTFPPYRIFIPVEDPNGIGQHIWVVDKDIEGKITKEKLYGVRYVPLTDAPPAASNSSSGR
jgi:protein-L-isoaspartate O-methyltransferase